MGIEKLKMKGEAKIKKRTKMVEVQENKKDASH